MSFLADLSSKRVLLIGAGTTGVGLVDFLSERVSELQIFDEKVSEISGRIVISELPVGPIDLAVVSPGWKKNHPIIEKLRQAEVQILSELDLAWVVKEEVNPGQKWVAITGTNGKTTTVQMLESILKEAKVNAIACGNVGYPAIAAVADSANFEILALELSSFQIDWAELPSFEAVAILNIAEDHIDWHGSFANYANAKLKLLEMTKCAILNLSEPEIILRSASWAGKKIFFGLDTPQAGEIGLVEELVVDRAFVTSPEAAELFAEISDIKPTVPHNVANAMAAGGIALALGIPHPVVKAGLAAFELDHHRLELVKASNEVNWVNDSKATNPHAASAALASSLSNIWIAGGLAKGAKMESLVQKSASRIKAAILIGTDRELIAQALTKYAPHVAQHKVDCDGTSQELMDLVVKKAIELAEPGDTVLLAPACASMDQFKSYAERGSTFASAVDRLVK